MASFDSTMYEYIGGQWVVRPFYTEISAAFKTAPVYIRSGGAWKLVQTLVGDNFASYCAGYQAVYNAMTNKPNSTNAGYQNTLVQSLVTGGYWARMDIFYVFAQESNSANEALINWKNPGTYNCTNNHSTAWTSLEGFTGDGANDYLSTNYNPSTNGVNCVHDSNTLGIYQRINVAENAPSMAATDGTNMFSIAARWTGDIYYVRSENALSFSGANNDSRGLFTLTRTSSTQVEAYRNTTKIIDSAGTDPSVALPSANVEFLRRSGSGLSTNQVSIGFVMDKTNITEITAIYNAIQTYMTALGKQV